MADFADQLSDFSLWLEDAFESKQQQPLPLLEDSILDYERLSGHSDVESDAGSGLHSPIANFTEDNLSITSLLSAMDESAFSESFSLMPGSSILDGLEPSLLGSPTEAQSECSDSSYTHNKSSGTRRRRKKIAEMTPKERAKARYVNRTSARRHRVLARQDREAREKRMMQLDAKNAALLEEIEHLTQLKVQALEAFRNRQ
jgi:hypothetical protein